MKVLYITYNGLLEPIGRSQVCRYVIAQSARHQFVVVSFEKAEELRDRATVALVASQLQEAGAKWISIPYLRNRPRIIAPVLNFMRGIWTTLLAARRHGIDVIHARSYPGALIALPANILLRIPFLFDMRGFWPDEGVGVARWSQGSIVHRSLKQIERVLLKRAGGMVTLSESGAKHLSRNFPEAGGNRPIAVIPTCADLSMFYPSNDRSAASVVLGYAGSANEAYLFDKFLLTYLALKRRVPSATMLILNRNDHAYIRDELAQAAISSEDFELKAVDPEQMPIEVRRMTVGTIFVFPYAAKVGSTPTKMAEFLATGIPCIGNSGCGDVAEILELERVGVSIESFSEDQIERVIDRLIHLLEDSALEYRCRETAHRRFSLEMACEKYDQLYRALQASTKLAIA